MIPELAFYIACFLLGFIAGLIAFRVVRRLRWSRMPRIPAELPPVLRSMAASRAARDAAKAKFARQWNMRAIRHAERLRKQESDLPPDFWPTPPPTREVEPSEF